MSGHQRLDILKEKKAPFDKDTSSFQLCDDVFPVRTVDWPLEKEQAANLASNSPSLAGQFTDETNELLELLKGNDEDLFKMLRFNELESKKILPVEDVPIPETVESICAMGDVWKLGNHTLTCGNCMDENNYLDEYDVCITDPPYGASIDYDEYDDSREALVALINGFMPIVLGRAKNTFLTCGNAQVHLYPEVYWLMGWFFHGGGVVRYGYNCFQPILCYGKDPSLVSCNGSRPDAIVTKNKGKKEKIDHPCPKPLEFWEWLFRRTIFKENSLIIDPFVGSGTSIVIAEQLGHSCHGIDTSAKYCDITIERWQNYTGKKAVLEGNSLKNGER